MYSQCISLLQLLTAGQWPLLLNYNCVSTELFLLQVALADLMLKQQNMEFGTMPHVMRKVFKNSILGTRGNWGKGNSCCGGI